jgi:hypothetical protein
MTSTINFTDLKQKMELLCQLHAESNIPANDGQWDRRERYIELRREVSRILMPLFTDLNFTEMLVLWTKGTAKTMAEVDADPTLKISSLDTLEFNGLNSGIQMSIKEHMAEF